VCKKLADLDIAYNISRHITTASCASFLDMIAVALDDSLPRVPALRERVLGAAPSSMAAPSCATSAGS